MISEELKNAKKLLKNYNENKISHKKAKELFKTELDLSDEEIGYVIEALLNRDIIILKRFAGSQGEIYKINLE